MTKQYEVLAKESTVTAASKKLYEETMAKFSKAGHYFAGVIRTLAMLEDSEVNKALQSADRQDVKPASTVQETLDYMLDFWAKSEDVKATINRGNLSCVADILRSDGSVLVAAVPVDELMGLENRLAELKKLFDHAPSLQAGIAWESDNSVALAGAVKSPPVVNTKTQKTPDWVTVVEPTATQAAIVKERVIDSIVGTYTTITRSGNIDTIKKANLLAKLDEMLMAVKQARNRANDTEVQNFAVGTAIVAELKAVLNG